MFLWVRCEIVRIFGDLLCELRTATFTQDNFSNCYNMYSWVGRVCCRLAFIISCYQPIGKVRNSIHIRYQNIIGVTLFSIYIIDPAPRYYLLHRVSSISYWHFQALIVSL